MRCSLPPFTCKGLLPVGDYPMTLADLRACYLVTGKGVQSSTWDAAWRGQLVDNLEILVRQIWQVGVDRIVISGSFVEDKDDPIDIDGSFAVDLRYLASGRPESDLSALDPHKVWTGDPASRQPDHTSAQLQLLIWHR